MPGALIKVVSSLDPIGLDSLKSSLTERIDTKFIFHQDLLPEILDRLRFAYQVLDVNGYRLSPYSTLYYDTPDLELYYDHHRGKCRRFKVRIREYLSSDLRFLEVKAKRNRMLSVKKRIERQDINSPLSSKEEAFIRKLTGHDYLLQPALTSYYERITLASHSMNERLTFDVNLAFMDNGHKTTLDNLVIAELKRGRSEYSEFSKVCSLYNLHPLSISKYCMGISLMKEGVRFNRFKRKHILIDKVRCHDSSGNCPQH